MGQTDTLHQHGQRPHMSRYCYRVREIRRGTYGSPVKMSGEAQNDFVYSVTTYSNYTRQKKFLTFLFANFEMKIWSTGETYVT